MAVDKFSISLPEALLAELDDLADADGLTRSAVIREAAADYVATRKAELGARRRRERVGRAIGGFRAISEQWGDDRQPGVQYIRDLRAESACEGADADDSARDD